MRRDRNAALTALTAQHSDEVEQLTQRLTAALAAATANASANVTVNVTNTQPVSTNVQPLANTSGALALTENS